jgi:hypothetical protein
MREIGRTPIVKGTINPDYSEANEKSKFTIHVSNEALLTSCSLEIEVFDTDARGKMTDFLGVIKLQGPVLSEFLENGANSEQQFDLTKSKKLSEQDNKHVQGTIVLRGSKRAINEEQKTSSKPEDGLNDIAYVSAKEFFDLPLNPKSKSFYFYPITVRCDKGILRNGVKQVICKVIFNGIMISTIIQAPQSEQVISFDDCLPVELRIPDNFPVGGCRLSTEIYLEMNNNEIVSLGVWDIHGVELKSALKKSLEALALMKEVPLCSAINSQTASDNKFTYYFSLGNFPRQMLKLKVRSCKNLAKADLFGKR